ncbi:hypothetical protein Pmani_022321 [Petrolisthes manimaculis]|uniref:Bicarbonate transporter-like transmembrane domain-containing protein n=2 Tax=Petrolisthes manimaculis TaxID=1843537 RepID=A0AAE1U288_9EUCA|nr:hypothetical protein Pmani_022321 [Petrolisthes manimaculis]
MNNLIGVGETLLISCVNGLLFALFACQPLLIVGATGPLMIFDMSLYHFAKTYELDFLSLRVWIGVWMTVFGLLVAAFEAVAIVKKFTRFTEEIFSTLVCLIFIYESFVKLIAIFQTHPLISEYVIMPVLADINTTTTNTTTMDTMEFMTTTIANTMDMDTMDMNMNSTEKETLGDQKETLGDQKETLGDQKETLGDQKETLGDQKETLGDQKETLGDQKETLGDQKETLGDLNLIP